MNIIEKIDDLLKEKKEETISKGLLDWVASYIEMRQYGNINGAKQIKKDIDKQIKQLKLNKKDVYFYFGDPDNPKGKEQVMKKIEHFRRGK